MPKSSSKPPSKSRAKLRLKTSRAVLKRPKKAHSPSKKKKKLDKLLRKSRAAQKTPLGTSKFRALRDQWYAKLEKKDFRDVEHTLASADDSTRYMQNGSLSAIAKRYNPETLHYYRRWSAYLAHCKHNIKSKQEQKVLQLYSDGESYRDISYALKPQYKEGVSIYSIHHVIMKWLPVVVRWNKVSQHGLDFEADIGLPL